MNRRQFFLGSSLGALAFTGLTASASEITSDSLEAVSLIVNETVVPPGLDGFKIAFLADLHLGACLSEELVLRALRIAKAFSPDLLLLGGDYIWHAQGTPTRFAISLKAQKFCDTNNEVEAPQIYSTLRRLIEEVAVAERTFGVLGNHDRWAVELPVIKRMESSHIRLLVNEDVTIDRGGAVLRIIGVDDYWTGMPALPAIVDEPPANELRVVLSHNPDFFTSVLEGSRFRFHLGLCGHTHGGQVKLPLIGAPFYNVADRRLGEGLFRHPRGLVYTTRGVGTAWFPIRINCRPEVTLITFTHRG